MKKFREGFSNNVINLILSVHNSFNSCLLDPVKKNPGENHGKKLLSDFFISLRIIPTPEKNINVSLLQQTKNKCKILRYFCPFNTQCPLKDHTYLNKSILKPADLFKYVSHFSRHQEQKGYISRLLSKHFCLKPFIPYLKKNQKIYELRDANLEFC